LLRSRFVALVVALASLACAGHRKVAPPPLFPLTPAWKTLLDDFVVEPLAFDARRVFVATRDGAVRALDPDTGAVLWKVEGMGGHLSAAAGVVLVRAEDGRLTSLHPRTGSVRWTVETSVSGELPAVLDGGRAFLAGRGVASVDLGEGRLVWLDGTGVETTSPPAVAGARLVSGEKDGTLRCRDGATGVTRWTLATGSEILAPALVDEGRRRLYLGTTDRRIMEVNLQNGHPGWKWPVGADIAHAGLLLPSRVIFAGYDAVLWALRPGGNLVWRGPLPSRPLSAPLLVDGQILVACLENEVVALASDTGKTTGSLRTSSEIRTAPILAGSLIVLGLRDRSVVAFAPPGAAAAPAAPEPPVVEPSPPGR
jgi:outer membrane protein assembly factor BamB